MNAIMEGQALPNSRPDVSRPCDSGLIKAGGGGGGGGGGGDGHGDGRTLSFDEDSKVLSKLMCLTRSQIEAFAATQQDADARRRSPPAIGRVGIRCVHCAHLPEKLRSNGSVSYPNSIRLMHQAVRNWQRYHFQGCSQIPLDVKLEYERLQDEKEFSSRKCQQYWRVCCERMGMVDTDPNNGIRFDSAASALDQDHLSSGAVVATAGGVGGHGKAGWTTSSSNATGHAAKAEDVPSNLANFSTLASNNMKPDLMDPARGNHSTGIGNGNGNGMQQTNETEEFLLRNRSEEAAPTPQEVLESKADVLGITVALQETSLNLNPNSNNNNGCCFLPNMSFADPLPLKIAELEREIQINIPKKKKCAFLEARVKCPDLVDKFHLSQFLQRENFDSKLAARRLVTYWELRKDLFGAERFFLPLTLAGALRGDLAAISSGFVSLLPFKDGVGRGIVFFNFCYYDLSKFSTDSMLRAIWYILHVANEDPEVLRSGTIFLATLQHARPNQLKKNYFQGVKSFVNNSPFRQRAFHICHPNGVFRIMSFLMSFLGPFFKTRARFHSGSEEKVLRALQEYKIERNQIPSILGGSLAVNQGEWVSNRFAHEHAVASAGYNAAQPTLTVAEGSLMELDSPVHAIVPSASNGDEVLRDDVSDTDSFLEKIEELPGCDPGDQEGGAMDIDSELSASFEETDLFVEDVGEPLAWNDSLKEEQLMT